MWQGPRGKQEYNTWGFLGMVNLFWSNSLNLVDKIVYSCQAYCQAHAVSWLFLIFVCKMKV